MTQINTDLIPSINHLLEIDLPENISMEQIKETLGQYINNLIQNDFKKLVAILYRIDINEKKLKLMLEQNTQTDAASIITDLIIERQLQKIKSRQEFSRDNNISEEEKW